MTEIAVEVGVARVTVMRHLRNLWRRRGYVVKPSSTRPEGSQEKPPAHRGRADHLDVTPAGAVGPASEGAMLHRRPREESRSAPKRLMGVTDLARYLGLPVEAIASMEAAGELPPRIRLRGRRVWFGPTIEARERDLRGQGGVAPQLAPRPMPSATP